MGFTGLEFSVQKPNILSYTKHPLGQGTPAPPIITSITITTSAATTVATVATRSGQESPKKAILAQSMILLEIFLMRVAALVSGCTTLLSILDLFLQPTKLRGINTEIHSKDHYTT